jgi:hypothetical protein
MRINTDSHLKTKTVTVKKRFQELPQVLRWCQKKVFCEDKGIHVFGEFFLGFFNRGHHLVGGPLVNCLV